MSLLQRLAAVPSGRHSKWAVVAAWLLIFGLFGWLAGHVGDVEDNDEANWMPGSAQSTKAVQLARQEFPEHQTASLVLVYARGSGLADADREAVARDIALLTPLADGPVAGPQASADGQALLVTVPIEAGKLETGELTSVVQEARRIASDGLPDGLTVKATGLAASRVDSVQANGQIDTTLTVVTVLVVAVLLLLIYRSVFLVLLPLLCMVAAVVVSQGAAYLAGKAGTVVSGSSFVLMIVLVFGLGTDYALLLVSRYREELRSHQDRHDAMAAALRGTLPSVAASAATMALAALVLLAATMNSTKGLGPVAAIAVLSAMAAMTTLLPALLVCFGRWVFWPHIPRVDTAAMSHEDGAASGGVWAKIARLVASKPRRLWIGTALALAILSAGAFGLQVGALSGADNFTRQPESVAGQLLIARHFPAGMTAPAFVYVPAPAAREAARIAETIAGADAVGAVEASATGRWAHISVVLSGTPTSTQAQETVNQLRGKLKGVHPDALVGGQAAALLDQNWAMNRDLLTVVPLIIAVVVLVLAVMLRAVVAPLLLLGCALLSSAAALGLSTLLFHALGLPRTDQSVLLLGFLFLVALGVDYTIFLMARAREEVPVRGHRAGVITALTATGGVITSAGVVLAATFLVLTVTPVVLNIQIGLLVASGVLIDALVVRTFLVPALTLDVGLRTWWPAQVKAS